MEGESAQRRGETLRAAGDPDAARWLAGAVGERRVADALTTLSTSWTVIHDRLLLPGLTESNLDHVLVGPPGVVLVDAKNFSGDITVFNGSLFQHLGRGDGRTSRNLIGEVKKVHWMAVQASTRLGVPVTPVLCLTGNRRDRFGEPQLVRGVWVVALGTLVPWLGGLRVRTTEDEVRRLVPRLLSEFPSTTTDPELLAAIGRDLAKATPGRSGHRPARPAFDHAEATASTPPPSARPRIGRRAVWRLIRLAVLAGLFVWGIQNVDTMGNLAADVLAPALSGAQEGASRTGGALPTPLPPTVVPGGGELDCDAISAERLSAYVDIPVVPWHGEDGVCRWLAAPADPMSVIVTAELVPDSTVASLPGDTVHLSTFASLHPPGPTSVLLARAGQWIPVADTRTEAQWPMRVEIHRGPLGIEDTRGQQILRAVAADLNAVTGE